MHHRLHEPILINLTRKLPSVNVWKTYFSSWLWISFISLVDSSWQLWKSDISISIFIFICTIALLRSAILEFWSFLKFFGSNFVISEMLTWSFLYFLITLGRYHSFLAFAIVLGTISMRNKPKLTMISKMIG